MGRVFSPYLVTLLLGSGAWLFWMTGPALAEEQKWREARLSSLSGLGLIIVAVLGVLAFNVLRHLAGL